MQLEVKVPQLSESVSEATVARWTKKAGDAVRKDEILHVAQSQHHDIGRKLFTSFERNAGCTSGSSTSDSPIGS